LLDFDQMIIVKVRIILTEYKNDKINNV